ncbi:MAG: hypothetical protein H6603_05125 [Flavobacteriales bacterium]|nr:hypothetical protein [Flavobacteriales bacterium]MCB9191336.1 hypothetical protein [Flavobacteriales bacterium]MCB9204343.1 hypothetical protein [Flavobacteriales bacterium]
MKTTPIFLIATIIFGSIFSSCNQDPDGNDGPFTLPDLAFDYSVTGNINQSGSWESPQNNNELGGHDNGVICNHSTQVDGISIVGTSPTYSFNLTASAANVEPGTYQVTNASFTDGNGGAFATPVSGTLRIDVATINFTATGVTYYTIDGNFTSSINDGFTPPNNITFSGNFTGLNVQSI